MRLLFYWVLGFSSVAACYMACMAHDIRGKIRSISDTEEPTHGAIWLSHEHILVDFIGADSIRPDRWNRDSVIHEMLPHLEYLRKYQVAYFVDATPDFLGRDVLLLSRLSEITGIKILTNTGLYGARSNKFIPDYAFESTSEDLAESWISEFRNGIDGTSVKPGFIKIGVDAKDTLEPMHRKLIHAAAITHLKTGLTIASHTGPAQGLWPQLSILKTHGVSPRAFIWVHAQNEIDNYNYLKAADTGCWISIDNFGWEQEENLGKLVFAKENDFLDQILISHDAGWFDPNKQKQSIQPFSAIFEVVIPRLKARGFSTDEIDLLLKHNPASAFQIKIRKR